MKELVFFNVKAYEAKEVPLAQLKEEIFTFFAEHLYRPTKRRAVWDGRDWLHPDGTRYRDILETAIAGAEDPEVKARYLAEKEGWERAGEFALAGKAFVLLSMPGEVYRNPQYGAKSMTYLARPSGDYRGGVEEYEVFSIPSNELSAWEHAAAVRKLAGEIEEDQPNILVAHPYLAVATLGALDEMAGSLGYKNFEEISEQAERTLEAQEDIMARGRRETMVDYFAEELFEVQTDVFLRETRERVREAVARVMHYYFAMEAGGGFVGKSFSEIEGEIKQFIVDEVEKQKVWEGLGEEGEGWGQKYSELSLRDAERMARLMANTRARQSFMVTGCAVSTMTADGGRYTEYLSEAIVGSSAQADPWRRGELTIGKVEAGEEKLHEGEKACYKCPACRNANISPEGDVILRSGYLVCSTKPHEHRLKYSASD